MRRILIVDQLNMFFRSYIVDPSMSAHGYPVGGLKGCLNNMLWLCEQARPDMIIVCWDGEGGSKKRKLINSDYKEGRKPIRLNRDSSALSEEEEGQNKIWQQVRLMDYYNHMPIIQLVHPSTEADDLVSFIVTSKRFEDDQKVIVSSDKDYFQLLDNKTIIVRPTQKEIMTKNDVITKYGLHPNNFALARALAGDPSDNLKGVGGAGLMTVEQRFPLLKEERGVTLDELKAFCTEQLNKKKPLKVFENAVKNWDIVEENYKLMQLYVPTMSYEAKTACNAAIDNFEPTFNKMEIIKMLKDDGVEGVSLSELQIHFNKIIRVFSNEQ